MGGVSDLHAFVAEHQAVARQLGETLIPAVEATARAMFDRLDRGGRVYVFGNGGSAADAQHFAAELVGRARRERRPLPAMALTTDSSALTAIGNDYEFGEVFARPLRALCGQNDIVVGITTSGTSENVVRGLATGHALGALTVSLTGGAGGAAAASADHALVVPSDVTARIQEMHILLIHLLCELIDDWALGTGSERSA
ncbi:MAG: SIS domain-containing protein [Candidatus Limnocylindria bacterium]